MYGEFEIAEHWRELYVSIVRVHLGTLCIFSMCNFIFCVFSSFTVCILYVCYFCTLFLCTRYNAVGTCLHGYNIKTCLCLSTTYIYRNTFRLSNYFVPFHGWYLIQLARKPEACLYPHRVDSCAKIVAVYFLVLHRNKRIYLQKTNNTWRHQISVCLLSVGYGWFCNCVSVCVCGDILVVLSSVFYCFDVRSFENVQHFWNTTKRYCEWHNPYGVECLAATLFWSLVMMMSCYWKSFSLNITVIKKYCFFIQYPYYYKKRGQPSFKRYNAFIARYSTFLFE